MKSPEHTEAVVVEKLVKDWCEKWKVDPAKLEREWKVDENGRLQLVVSGPLLVPITSLRTQFNILNPDDELENGHEITL